MRVVILAAGDFPAKGSEGERLLRAAETVVACDSAAEAYFQWAGKWPDVVIGDMDSLESATRRGGAGTSAGAGKSDAPRGVALPRSRCIRISDQNTNDLTKAIDYVLAEGLAAPATMTIVGATGKREDHTIGNVYRALEAGIRIVTDAGEFVPVNGSVRLKTWKENGVSVFASDPATQMTSRGLRWPLEGVRFTNPYVATLNRAANEWITVRSDRRAFVYLANNPRACRAVVALGSYLGTRAAYLHQALRTLARLPETRLVDVSRVIETKGVDVPAEFANQDFFNQVALFETTLEPLDFSRRMHAIEDGLGRVRTVRNGPRTIDLDLITFGGVRLETPELTLPHPRARARAFVTEPLRELGLLEELDA